MAVRLLGAGGGRDQPGMLYLEASQRAKGWPWRYPYGPGGGPYLVATMPALLAAFDGIRRAVGSGELDPVHRETAGVAVGVAVDNHYGVAFHSTVLGRLGVAEDEIKRMRAGEEPADEPTAAVYALARGLALHRGKVDELTVDRAATAGLSTAQILELVAECAFASLVGMVDNLAGRVPLDEFLQPRAWAATG